MKFKLNKFQWFPLLSTLALSSTAGFATAPVSRGSMLPIVTGMVGPGFHRDIGDNQAELAFLWNTPCTLFSGKGPGAMKDRPWQKHWLLGVGGHDLMGTRQLSGLVGLFVHTSSLEASLHYQPLFSIDEAFQDQCGQALKKAAKRLEVKCRPQWHPLFPVISVLPISLFDAESYNLGVGWGVDLFSHLKVNLGIHLPTREVSFEHLANIYGGISLKTADKVPALWVTKSLSSQIRPVNRVAQGQASLTQTSAATKGNHPSSPPQPAHATRKAPKAVNRTKVNQGTTSGSTPVTAHPPSAQGTAATTGNQGNPSTSAAAAPSASDPQKTNAPLPEMCYSEEFFMDLINHQRTDQEFQTGSIRSRNREVFPTGMVLRTCEVLGPRGQLQHLFYAALVKGETPVFNDFYYFSRKNPEAGVVFRSIFGVPLKKTEQETLKALQAWGDKYGMKYFPNFKGYKIFIYESRPEIQRLLLPQGLWLEIKPSRSS